MKTSILFIIDYLDFGGAGKMMKYVANICANHFDDISLLSLYEKERSGSLSEKVKFYSLEESQTGGALWRINLIKKLRGKIKAIRPDVVCTFVSDTCFSVRLATLGMGLKVVSAERGDPYTNTFPWTILVKWAYVHSNYCFFQLEKARDYYGDRVARKSFVIPNVFIAKPGNTPYRGERKRTIVSAGRFVKEKGYDVLIKAFAKVHEIHPEYTMTIYGEGPLIDQYHKLAKELGVDGLITYPGYVKDVAASVREDGVFVLPSRYEGIPNSLIEALSVGIPCVATDCTPGGPMFLTKGGVNGLLVPVDNVDAMAEAILKVIEDENFAESLSKKGSEIIEELKPSVIDRQWIEAFNCITNKKN